MSFLKQKMFSLLTAADSVSIQWRIFITVPILFYLDKLFHNLKLDTNQA